MTYPPQGQYGQQPDPYGQQQPQYGGGYQQQPQYGGYDPNAQQYGGGYGQQYGGLGGGPQPPKNNKGPIIAVVTIVVLILGGFGVTGFVAPGFLVSDDKGGNTGSGSTTSTSDKPDEGDAADAFVEQLVTAADEKDKNALKDLQCSDATDDVTGATNSIDEIDGAELKDVREVSDSEVVATLNITVNGDADDYEATVVKDGGDWCWQDITSGSSGSGSSSTDDSTDETATSETIPSPGGGATGDSDGEKFVQSFLDKLNAGDGAGAAAMSCADSSSQSDITETGGQSPQIQVDPEGVDADSAYVGADLKGTLEGKPASGRTSAFTDDNGNWCIYTFFFFED